MGQSRRPWYLDRTRRQVSDLKGISLAKRYEIIRSLSKDHAGNHHELCEVTAGRKLGYWAEDMCDCATAESKPDQQSGTWTGLGDK
jgi:hypothetical protein